MEDPRLDDLGPRPAPSAGWVALRDWFRARNARLHVPRFRYQNPAPSPRCAHCAELVTTTAGDRCSACGELLRFETLATPEAALDLEQRLAPEDEQ